MRASFLLAISLVACGPALREQQLLAARVQAAAKSCKANRLRCQSADLCARRAQTAQSAIQSAQEARSRGQAIADQEANAAGSYAAADSICKAGGW